MLVLCLAMGLSVGSAKCYDYDRVDIDFLPSFPSLLPGRRQVVVGDWRKGGKE